MYINVTFSTSFILFFLKSIYLAYCLCGNTRNFTNVLQLDGEDQIEFKDTFFNTHKCPVYSDHLR